MEQMVCLICGYCYDPDKGDTKKGIPSGTRFDKLPAEWVCPECGATKDSFEGETS